MGSRFWQGRWPVVLAIVAVSAIFTLGWFTTGESDRAWRLLGVPSLFPTFADLRTITHAIDCMRKGLDPYTTGVCDPWGRLYNYPSIWLHLGAIGISSTSTNAIGLIFIGLLCASLLLIYDTGTATSGALAFAAAVSPPILLLLERGNIDVLMFVSLVISAYLMAKRTGLGATLAQSGLIAFLAILKIYPIAGAVVLSHKKLGYFAIALTCVLAAIGMLSVVGPGELNVIALNTPQAIGRSYGDAPIFMAAKDHGLLPATFDAVALRVSAGATALALASIAFTLSLLRADILRGILPVLDSGSARGAVAMSCMSVFCFSFLLGTNFDYRLVFLLGVLPALLDAYDVERRAKCLIVPGAIVLFLWLSRVSLYILVPFELLDWSLFVIGVMWLARSIFHQPSHE